MEQNEHNVILVMFDESFPKDDWYYNEENCSINIIVKEFIFSNKKLK